MRDNVVAETCVSRCLYARHLKLGGGTSIGRVGGTEKWNGFS